MPEVLQTNSKDGTINHGYKNSYDESYYYRQNSHGDVTALLDYAGNVLADYTYDAYGEEQIEMTFGLNFSWQKQNEIYNPFRYCGEYTDEETGYIYLRNRYYDTSIGRFVTEDPIQDGTNWYVYLW